MCPGVGVIRGIRRACTGAGISRRPGSRPGTSASPDRLPRWQGRVCDRCCRGREGRDAVGAHALREPQRQRFRLLHLGGARPATPVREQVPARHSVRPGYGSYLPQVAANVSFGLVEHAVARGGRASSGPRWSACSVRRRLLRWPASTPRRGSRRCCCSAWLPSRAAATSVPDEPLHAVANRAMPAVAMIATAVTEPELTQPEHLPRLLLAGCLRRLELR